MTAQSATPDIMECEAPQATGPRTIPLRMVRALVRGPLVFSTFKRATTTRSARPEIVECKAPPAPGPRTIPSGFPKRIVRALVWGLLALSILTGSVVFASATIPSLFGL